MIPKQLRGTWMERAACRGEDMMLINHTKRLEWHLRRPAEAARIMLCTRCEVLDECTNWVLSEDVDPCPFHIVAGMVPVQRGRLRKQSRRAS